MRAATRSDECRDARCGRIAAVS